MPNLTREALNELRRQQDDREAKRREIIRQAVANSEAPLPPDLARAVIRLNNEYTRAILREHRGFALAERRDSYLKSLAIMEQCLQDLLTAVCSFENAALAKSSSLLSPYNKDVVNCFERQIQKELFATANAAASLVDHTRRLNRCSPFVDFKAKILDSFGTDGLHDFVIALRVILHHLHMVDAAWSIHTSFSEGTETATFSVSKKTVLQVIAASPKRLVPSRMWLEFG